jgi:hypothetical protein
VLPLRAHRHALPSSTRQPFFFSFISVVVPSARTCQDFLLSRKMALHSSGVLGDDGAARLLELTPRARPANAGHVGRPTDRSTFPHRQK